MTEKMGAIKEMQGYIYNIAKVKKELPSVNPDGIFGEETKASVEVFQKMFALPVTGKVDFATWERMKSENNSALFELSEPVQIIEISSSDLPLVLGDKGRLVRQVNLMLTSLSEKFLNFKNAGSDDVFTEVTVGETKRWQRVIGHEESGEVDKLTWNTLAEMYIL